MTETLVSSTSYDSTAKYIYVLIGSKSNQKLQGTFAMDGGKLISSTNADYVKTSNEIQRIAPDSFDGITGGFFLAARPTDKFSMTFDNGQFSSGSGTAFIGPIILSNSEAIAKAKAASQSIALNIEPPTSTSFSTQTVNVVGGGSSGGGSGGSKSTSSTYSSVSHDSSDSGDDFSGGFLGVSWKSIIVKVAMAVISMLALLVFYFIVTRVGDRKGEASKARSNARSKAQSVQPPWKEPVTTRQLMAAPAPASASQTYYQMPNYYQSQPIPLEPLLTQAQY